MPDGKEIGKALVQNYFFSREERISNHGFFNFLAVKPYFTMEPEDATVQSGDSVRFVCEVAGDPEPVVVSKPSVNV